MDLSCADKRAVVCGGSQGIGRAAAIELARLGASVTLIARGAPALEAVCCELDQTGNQSHQYRVADFSDMPSVHAAIEAITDSGTVHVLVNNTGGPPGGTALDASVDEFRQAFHNHLMCNQILTKAFVPGMKQSKYGRIVNVISTSVKQPIVGLGVSNTIRGAVANWAKTLAGELGPYGITVNNVLPGSTQTGRLQQIIADRAKAAGTSEEAVIGEMQERIPVGRFAEPWEVGAAIAFLASPAASYINGINLPVDGGATTCL